ncbi:MAG: family 2 glycosyl transferase [Pelagibacteraceae bacterium]|nr:family 2 glycosyl transferase [Pelagibacteraceae bacterium]PPR33283.1 MAG: Undecaprenyl-phosphate 4-deoxy-4-formamido-L-arabinose transferase [Alphaproteobacteria bacterium MarineAlpha6_Bin5]|tara:strand:+ start:85 stop:831 length:747 start_codon:yes stop_codon:yes gene_type:complete
MHLSIIIPVFNEIKLLPKILFKLVRDTKKINKEIIIVDDSSNDGTKDWLQKINSKFNFISIKKNKLCFSKKKKKNLKIILKNRNEGKGSAVIIGLKNISNNVIVIQDSDLEYMPRDLNKMFNIIKNNNADIVYGNRFSSKKNKYHYLFFAIGNYILSSLVSILFKVKVSDTAVCYKMFSKKVIKNLSFYSKDFNFDFEFTSKILKNKKWRFKEIDIVYQGRTFEEGKKISWIDGIRALVVILKVKFFS